TADRAPADDPYDVGAVVCSGLAAAAIGQFRLAGVIAQGDRAVPDAGRLDLGASSPGTGTNGCGQSSGGCGLRSDPSPDSGARARSLPVAEGGAGNAGSDAG